MTGAGGVTVVQAASVPASISPKATKLLLVLLVDRLCPPQSFTLSLGDLLQCSHMLRLTRPLVPLMHQMHPQNRRRHVRQRQHGQAPDG